jgi:hypothetical protein
MVLMHVQMHVRRMRFSAAGASLAGGKARRLVPDQLLPAQKKTNGAVMFNILPEIGQDIEAS